MTFDSKTSRILLPSAARTVATATGIQQEASAVAVRLYLTVTIASGTGGIWPVIRGYDRASLAPNTGGGSVTGYTSGLGCVELTTGGVPLTQIGSYAYEMTYYPSDPFGNIREAVSRAVPYVYDVIVKVADSSSYTYSVSIEILR